MAKAIKEEEAEKTRIEQDMAVLHSRLAHIKESLQKKVCLLPLWLSRPGPCRVTCMPRLLARAQATT